MGTLSLVPVLLSLLLATAGGEPFSVTINEGSYSLHQGHVTGWVARGYFQDNTFVDGWGYLEIETNRRYPEEVQAYAAGFAEGAATTDMIYKSYRNTLEGFCEWKGPKFCEKLRQYLKTNFDWMLSEIPAKGDSCPVWHNVGLILQQLRGMEEGYNLTAQNEIPPEALLLMNLGGDLGDLESAFTAKFTRDDSSLRNHHGGSGGHCSALVKVLPGNADLYVSHTTWGSYEGMLRIQKKLVLPFRRTGSSDYKDINPGHTVSFSSSPGLLHSADDFYTLSSGLVSMETTIDNYNPDLWKNIKATGQLAEWIRVIVANRVATDGRSWSKYFSMYNSGTYNNQWMVIDYNKFKMGQSIRMMNLSGDLEDLEAALMADEVDNAESKDHPRARNEGHVTGAGHCSSLIKVLPGNTDLYVSHVTWNTYQSMLRIHKKYSLPFRRTGSSDYKDVNPGHTVSFSSYPGILHSGDDFYILSSGLVTLETTIGNGNPDLWKNVNATGQIEEWIRVIVANRVATDGESWSKFFSMHNSGTYNNQWMIVDYNKFKMGQIIRNGTLWVLEQLPGYIQSGDQSHILRKQTYWPSYNVPFYENIFNLSGAPAMVEKFGNWFSYDKTPRALIFLRDHVKVKSIPSMIKLMRYNDFQNDPLSLCDCTPPYSAENAISARSDLNPKNGTYPFGALGHRSHGGTDMKLTSSGMIKHFSFYAVNGPTYDQQPVFEWSKQDFADDTPHYGHPDAWKFPVVKVKWLW